MEDQLDWTGRSSLYQRPWTFGGSISLICLLAWILELDQVDQTLGLGGLDLVLGHRTKWTVMEDQVDLTWSSGLRRRPKGRYNA